MAYSQYTEATNIIGSLGTTPEDRPGMTDQQLKDKFDENAVKIKAFLNALIAEMLSTATGKGASQIGLEDSAGRFTATQVEAALAELAGSGRTTETVKSLADLISNHTGELFCESKVQTIDMAATSTGTQITVSGLAAKPKRIDILAFRSDVAEQAFSEGVWAENGGGTQNCVFNADNSLVKNTHGSGFRYQGNGGAGAFLGVISSVTTGSFKFDITKAGTTPGTLKLIITCTYH